MKYLAKKLLLGWLAFGVWGCCTGSLWAQTVSLDVPVEWIRATQVAIPDPSDSDALYTYYLLLHLESPTYGENDLTSLRWTPPGASLVDADAVEGISDAEDDPRGLLSFKPFVESALQFMRKEGKPLATLQETLLPTFTLTTEGGAAHETHHIDMTEVNAIAHYILDRRDFVQRNIEDAIIQLRMSPDLLQKLSLPEVMKILFEKAFVNYLHFHAGSPEAVQGFVPSDQFILDLLLTYAAGTPNMEQRLRSEDPLVKTRALSHALGDRIGTLLKTNDPKLPVVQALRHLIDRVETQLQTVQWSLEPGVSQARFVEISRFKALFRGCSYDECSTAREPGVPLYSGSHFQALEDLGTAEPKGYVGLVEVVQASGDAVTPAGTSFLLVDTLQKLSPKQAIVYLYTLQRLMARGQLPFAGVCLPRRLVVKTTINDERFVGFLTQWDGYRQARLVAVRLKDLQNWKAIHEQYAEQETHTIHLDQKYYGEMGDIQVHLLPPIDLRRVAAIPFTEQEIANIDRQIDQIPREVPHRSVAQLPTLAEVKAHIAAHPEAFLERTFLLDVSYVRLLTGDPTHLIDRAHQIMQDDDDRQMLLFIRELSEGRETYSIPLLKRFLKLRKLDTHIMEELYFQHLYGRDEKLVRSLEITAKDIYAKDEQFVAIAFLVRLHVQGHKKYKNLLNNLLTRISKKLSAIDIAGGVEFYNAYHRDQLVTDFTMYYEFGIISAEKYIQFLDRLLTVSPSDDRVKYNNLLARSGTTGEMLPYLLLTAYGNDVARMPPHLQQLLATAFREHFTDDDIPILRQLSAPTQETPVRQAALFALQKSDRPEEALYLRETLGDKNLYARTSALKALNARLARGQDHGIDLKVAVRQDVERLVMTDEPFIRVAGATILKTFSAEAVGGISDRLAAHSLSNVLHSESEVQEFLIQLLGTYLGETHREGVEQILEMLVRTPGPRRARIFAVDSLQKQIKRRKEPTESAMKGFVLATQQQTLPITDEERALETELAEVATRALGVYESAPKPLRTAAAKHLVALMETHPETSVRAIACEELRKFDPRGLDDLNWIPNYAKAVIDGKIQGEKLLDHRLETIRLLVSRDVEGVGDYQRLIDQELSKLHVQLLRAPKDSATKMMDSIPVLADYLLFLQFYGYVSDRRVEQLFSAMARMLTQVSGIQSLNTLADRVNTYPAAVSLAVWNRLLEDSFWGARLLAVRGLTKHPTPDVLPSVIRVAMTDPDVRVRANAYDTLGYFYFQDQQVPRLLISAIRKIFETQPAISDLEYSMAVQALSRLASREGDAQLRAEARAVMMAAAGSPHGYRIIAVRWLGRFVLPSGDADIEDLLVCLLDDPDPRVKVGAILALKDAQGFVQTEKVIKAIYRQLENAEAGDDARCSAANALGTIPHPLSAELMGNWVAGHSSQQWYRRAEVDLLRAALLGLVKLAVLSEPLEAVVAPMVKPWATHSQVAIASSVKNLLAAMDRKQKVSEATLQNRWVVPEVSDDMGVRVGAPRSLKTFDLVKKSPAETVDDILGYHQKGIDVNLDEYLQLHSPEEQVFILTQLSVLATAKFLKFCMERPELARLSPLLRRQKLIELKFKYDRDANADVAGARVLTQLVRMVQSGDQVPSLREAHMLVAKFQAAVEFVKGAPREAQLQHLTPLLYVLQSPYGNKAFHAATPQSYMAMANFMDLFLRFAFKPNGQPHSEFFGFIPPDLIRWMSLAAHRLMESSDHAWDGETPEHRAHLLSMLDAFLFTTTGDGPLTKPPPCGSRAHLAD